MAWAIYETDYLLVRWKAIDSLVVLPSTTSKVLKFLGMSKLYNAQTTEEFRYYKIRTALDQMITKYRLPANSLNNRPFECLVPNSFKVASSTYNDRDLCATLLDTHYESTRHCVFLDDDWHNDIIALVETRFTIEKV